MINYITANNALVGKIYLTPRDLKIKILKKNEDKSIEIELLEITEESVPKILTIPLDEASKTSVRLVGEITNTKAQIRVQPQSPEEVKQEPKEEILKHPKTKSDLIKEYILAGGKTSDEIALEVTHYFNDPSPEEYKKVKGHISVVYDALKKKGHKIEKDANKRFVVKK